MMVTERPVEHQVEFQFFERTPKRARISQAAKSRDSLETGFCHRNAERGIHVHPFARCHAAAEDRRLAIVTPQLTFQAGVVVTGLGAGHYNGCRTAEALSGFTAAS